MKARRSSRPRPVAFASVFATILFACNAVLGLDPLETYQGDGPSPGIDGSSVGIDGSSLGMDGSSPGIDDSSPGMDGSSTGLDGASSQADSGPVGGDGSFLGVDAAFSKPPCDPNEQPLDGTFVDPVSGIDSPTNGSKNQPLRSIKFAIAGSKGHIYLAEGTYNENLDVFWLKQDTVIHGGWVHSNAGWARDCNPGAVDRTILQSPDREGLKVTNLSSALSLEVLTVRSKPACGHFNLGQSPESCVGVLVRTATITLRDVNVVAGSGGSAKQPSVPDPVGNRPCDGVSGCTTSGGAGAAGMDGLPGAVGGFDDLGFVTKNGAPGRDGADGSHGSPGSTITKSCANPGQGQCADGKDGCGGTSYRTDVTSNPGKCGCGGRGGNGGRGGDGGGASIALFASGRSTVVTLERVNLKASDGGNGAPGAEGGAPGQGAQGQRGDEKICYDALAPMPAPGPGCVCGGVNNVGLPGGDPGSKGLAGGVGGKGGGGAGGSSFAVVSFGGATITQAAAGDGAHLIYGKPGEGAEGAPRGQAAPSYP